jgi:hypothetical protein
LWQGNYPAALDAARKVLSKLNNPVLRGYRATWNYLAGSAAELSGLAAPAKEQFVAAAKAAPALAWLVDLSRHVAPDTTPTENSQLAQQIEQLENNLMQLGTLHDRKFAKEEQTILEDIEKSEKQYFEPAHVKIGEFIGFRAGKKESSGSPDPWWILHDGVCLVFEDHAAGSETLDVTKARQAASHPNWIKDNVPLAKDCKIIPILVTPVVEIDKDVASHLRDVYVWPLEDFRAWVRNAVQTIRGVRRTFQAPGDLVWRMGASDALKQANLHAEGVLNTVLKNAARDFFRLK